MFDSPPPVKKLCVKAPAPPDAAAMSARLDAAVEATGRKVAKLDELEDPLRWKWHKAQKDGTPDEEAEALEGRWIAAYNRRKEARKEHKAALAALRTADLGPVPEIEE
jgi:hypothetical protein